MAESKYLRPIKRGEYDLVNISLLGFDPNTGKPYQECHDEWSAERVKLEAEGKTIRWWQFGRRRVYGQRVWALRTHLGM